MKQKYEVGQVAWVLIDYPTRPSDFELCKFNGQQWVDFNGDRVLAKSVLEVRLIEKPVVLSEAA